MQAVAHALSCNAVNGRYGTVAIIISRSGIEQHSERNDFSAINCELNDFISVLCFSSVSVVHDFSFGYWLAPRSMDVSARLQMDPQLLWRLRG